MAPRYFASEFPNDNLDLHAGAVWVVRTPCGPPEAELVLEETRPLVVGKTTKIAPPPLLTAAPEETQLLEMRAARSVPESTRGETTIEAFLTEEESEPVEAVEETADEEPVTLIEATPLDPVMETAVEPAMEVVAESAMESAAEIEAESVPATEPEPAPEPELVVEAAPQVEEIVATLAVEEPPAPLASMVVPASHREEDLAPMAEVVAEIEASTEDAPAPEESHVRVSEADPFATLVETMVDVAKSAGLELEPGTLADLLASGSAPLASLPGAAIAGLVDGGLATRDDATLMLTDTFAAAASAWRSVVREEEVDFAACGSRTLDEWSADLIARLAGAPAKTAEMRRELRSRGVAAFGLLAA